MTSLDKFIEPDKPKLTVIQMQRAVYRAVRNVMRESQEEFRKATLARIEAEMRLQYKTEEDEDQAYGSAWNREVKALKENVEYAKSRCANQEDNLSGWQEILDFVVMTGLGAKPSPVDHPIVENGSGI